MKAKPRCVLVDDDEDIRHLVRRIFLSICPDFDVVEFFSGLEALQFLAGNHVDLIITDFRMPFLDGLRLTAAVRSMDRHVPIILMSGDDVGKNALVLGANAFVAKTALMTELGSALERSGIHAHCETAV